MNKKLNLPNRIRHRVRPLSTHRSVNYLRNHWGLKWYMEDLSKRRPGAGKRMTRQYRNAAR